MNDKNTQHPRAHPSADAPLDDAVNLALDLEAAGDSAGAQRVLAEAATQDPHALARARALRAAAAELRAPIPPVPHTDLTSRVLDQWEREELLEPAGTAPPGHADTPYELAETAAWPTAPRGAAAGAGASQTRHRRPGGRPLRIRAASWTTMLAVGLGLAVAVGLYLSNTTRPTTPPRANTTPHLLNGESPVVMESPMTTSPLRLGNAGTYDRLASPTFAQRPARLRYEHAPTDTWVFADLYAPRFTARHTPSADSPFASLVGTDAPLTDPAADLLDPALGTARLRLTPDPIEPRPAQK